jgi:N6-adenosine-specific RNA methylase IME4
VADIAHGDAMLFLWVPNTLLLHAASIMEAWGFAYCSSMVWGKDSIAFLRDDVVHVDHFLLSAQLFIPIRNRSARWRSRVGVGRRGVASKYLQTMMKNDECLAPDAVERRAGSARRCAALPRASAATLPLCFAPG